MSVNLVLTVVSSLTVALAAVACGGSEQGTTNTTKSTLGGDFRERMADAPEWVRRGCAVYSAEPGTKVCGVGSMSGTRNLSLCRSTARSRGRTEIARSLNLKSSSTPACAST